MIHDEITHVVTFDRIILLCLMKRLKGYDFTNKSYKSKKIMIQQFESYANSSKYIINQRLIFDLLAVLKVRNAINGSNQNYRTHEVGF